jgi:hypothetical protein
MSGVSWWPDSAGAAPRHATRRNLELETDGDQVRAVAEALGTPLIPWQSYAADICGERRADGSYEYQVVIITVPRQTGKTTLIRALGTHRALVLGRDFFYTAQTGKDARERWMDLVKILRVNKALKDRWTLSLRGGSEQVAFADGGAFRVFAPTPESLHGYTPPTVCIDEAFAQSAAAGELLMGAIGPAQITIRDKQIIIVSTMGTAESVFLHDWIERAIGGMPRVAVLDWGAGDDVDPYTAAGVEEFHPGIGYILNGKVLEAADVLEQIERNTRAEYERAYANRRTLTTSNLIPPEVWRPLGDEQLAPPAETRDITLAYDVGLDRLSSTITAHWTTPAGKPAVKIVRAGPGVAWLADAVDDLVDRWRPADLVAVGNGPVLEVTAQLRARGRTVTELGEKDFATACGAFLTFIDDGGLVHDGGPILEQSVTGLVTRPGAVDGVAFSRRHSVGDSSAGIAAAAGLWVAARDANPGKPELYFGAA